MNHGLGLGDFAGLNGVPDFDPAVHRAQLDVLLYAGFVFELFSCLFEALCKMNETILRVLWPRENFDTNL